MPHWQTPETDNGLKPFAKNDALSGIIFSCLAFVGAILNLCATFPGYLYADSKVILEQIRKHIYSDWHSPFYTWLWSVLIKMLPSPEGIILFNIGGLWHVWCEATLFKRG